MPFTQSLVPSVLDGDTAPLGTQKFPWAMSFQDLLLDREIRYGSPQLGVLFLQIFQSSGLLQLQAAVLFPPPVEGLRGDPCLFTRQWHRLALANQHFNLPQLRHDLLRRERLLTRDLESFMEMWDANIHDQGFLEAFQRTAGQGC